MAGIHRKIREAYRNICLTYRDEEDRIVLTGFSRGAFTALCLARFINDVGLLHGSWVNKELPPIYKLWKKSSTTDPIASHSTSPGKLERRCRELSEQKRLRRGIKIDAFAAWDTVNSSKHLSFVGDKLPPNIQHAYHALALDERRRDFFPMILEPSGPEQSLNQCWFLGSHSDVGGGNNNSGLANIALCWMVRKLMRTNLVKFRDDIFKAMPHEGSILRLQRNKLGYLNADLQRYDSYRWYWRYWIPKNRVVGRKSDHEKIHGSVHSLMDISKQTSTRKEKLLERRPLVGFKIPELDNPWTAPDGSFQIPVEVPDNVKMMSLFQLISADLLKEVSGRKGFKISGPSQDYTVEESQ